MIQAKTNPLWRLVQFPLTRRLWQPIAIHIAWDFSLDGIYGVGTSGLSGAPSAGLLKAALIGPVWLTGGAAGVEASLVAVMIVLAAGIYLLWRVRRKGQVVNPPWMHSPLTGQAAAR